MNICPNCGKSFLSIKRHLNRKTPCNPPNPILLSPSNSSIIKYTKSTKSTKSTKKNQEIEVEKPFLKWVGGKSQILPQILPRIPSTIRNYYEPFLGGGSVLFGLLSLLEQNKLTITGTIYVNDLNQSLIQLYQNIRNYPGEFIQKLREICDTYSGIMELSGQHNPTTYEEAIISKESYYYWIRKEFNKVNKEIKQIKEIEETEENQTNSFDSLILQSAYFLFLNKTCFRGLYREGPNGFNVPFGNYKNPAIFEEEHILCISALLNKYPVEFSNVSFEDFIPNHLTNGGINDEEEKQDFWYIDPPYLQISDSSFIQYNKEGFKEQQHNRLFEYCKQMPRFLLSNANIPHIHSIFSSNDDINYNITVLECKRAINSKKPDSTSEEVLIANYL
jgi:DNA adenine methylase